jgi:chaperone modulatory protein CbpM
MVNPNVSIGELLDETTLTIDELAAACSVEPKWVLERIDAGVLTGTMLAESSWCFVSADLVRARRIVSVERSFEANPELAALVADLIEEVHRLKKHLLKAGLPEK